MYLHVAVCVCVCVFVCVGVGGQVLKVDVLDLKAFNQSPMISNIWIG